MVYCVAAFSLYTASGYFCIALRFMLELYILRYLLKLLYKLVRI